MQTVDRVDPGALAAEIERALARALAQAWQDLNRSHFRSQLRTPTLAIEEAASRLGQWRSDERTIVLQRRLVLDGGWGHVIEVLKHEMAHQFVSEVLGDPDPAAHGPAFRALCERLGIDARASGMPVAGGASPSESDGRLLQRIAKLLALAESPNQHEAELAMAEASRLMLKHNVEAPAAHDYGFRHLGTPTGRTSEHERMLAGLLADHFFVETIWVPVWRARERKRGSVLEACGTRVNLELAEYVYAFLLHTAELLWRDYRRTRGLSLNRERRTFLAGVIAGFREKLDAQRRRHQSEGLIWVGDADLSRYLRRRHPYVRTMYHSGRARSEAHADGRAAGRSLVLHKPVTAGSGSTRRLLGS